MIGQHALVIQGDPNSRPPSGWYPDSDPTYLRWWDGTQWTVITRSQDSWLRENRRRPLLRAGLTLLTAGFIMVTIAFPWIAGEPVKAQNQRVPTLVTVIEVIGFAAVALGVVCLVARWVMRDRPEGARRGSRRSA